MRMVNKIVLSVAIPLIVVFGWSVVLHKTTAPRTIKIGVSIPLTGTQAAIGEGLRNSILLAQGALESTRYTYDVVFEDNHFDPKTAASNAQKFVAQDNVDAIIDVYAPIGNVISPIAEKNTTPHISVAFDKKIAEGAYNFILFTKPETAAREFLVEMQKRNLSTLAVYKVNNQGILSIYQAIRDLSVQYGVTLVVDETFQPGERDFRGLIAKTSSTKADIYALLSLSPELEILAQQLRDKGVYNQTSVMYFELAQNRSVFEGLWSVGYGKVDEKFINEYRTKYGKEITFGVPNMYDAFNLIVAAAESFPGDEKPSREYIAQKLQGMTKTEGVLGTLSVDADGIIDSPAAIKTVRNGNMEIVH